MAILLFTLTAYLLAFLLFYTEVDGFSDAPTLMNPLISTQSPQSSENSDSCVGQCAFKFVDQLSKQLSPPSERGHAGSKVRGLLNLNYNDFLAAFSNATFFETFCAIYHWFQHCHGACPHGYMQQLLHRSSEIVDHFCVYNYREILAKFGCLAKLDRRVSKECLRKCTSHNEVVASLMQNFRRLAVNGDSTEAERHLSKSCEYVLCTLNCDVPSIAGVCDAGTAELVISLTKKSFESMQRMALDAGAVGKWPPACGEIKNYAMDIGGKSPPSEAPVTGLDGASGHVEVEKINQKDVVGQSPANDGNAQITGEKKSSSMAPSSSSTTAATKITTTTATIKTEIQSLPPTSTPHTIVNRVDRRNESGRGSDSGRKMRDERVKEKNGASGIFSHSKLFPSVCFTVFILLRLLAPAFSLVFIY